ncbi:MAG: hypothetical protein AAF799_45620 [Myxococcota bacterium]
MGFRILLVLAAVLLLVAAIIPSNIAVYGAASSLYLVWLAGTHHVLLVKKSRADQYTSSPENDMLTHWLQGAVVLFGGAFSLTQFTSVTAAESVQVRVAPRENGSFVRTCIDQRPGQDPALRITAQIEVENLGQVDTKRLLARASLEAPHVDELRCWGASLDSTAANDESRLCGVPPSDEPENPLEASIGALSAAATGSAVFHWWLPVTKVPLGWHVDGKYGTTLGKSHVTHELRITTCVQNAGSQKPARSECAPEFTQEDGIWTTTVRLDQLNLDRIGSCETKTPIATGNCYVNGQLVAGYSNTGLTLNGCSEHCVYCVERLSSSHTPPEEDGDGEAAQESCVTLWQPLTAGEDARWCRGSTTGECKPKQCSTFDHTESSQQQATPAPEPTPTGSKSPS